MSINGTFEVRYDSLWGYSTIMDSENKCFTMHHRRDCCFLKGPPLTGGYYTNISYTELLLSDRHADRKAWCTDTNQRRHITETQTDIDKTRLETDQRGRLTTKSHRVSLYRCSLQVSTTTSKPPSSLFPVDWAGVDRVRHS